MLGSFQAKLFQKNFKSYILTDTYFLITQYFADIYFVYKKQRTWEDTKSYCQSYNMSFLSIESYEEDLAVFNAFAGLESTT